jgi:3-(methylthio)propanoyl-CoA dehydrogenase
VANFYNDNKDLKFIVEQMLDWKKIIEGREDFESEDCPYENAEEAFATYRDLLEDPIGEMAANQIKARAEEVDRSGCKCVDGTVEFPEGLKRNLKDLCDAQLMGLTIPMEYGGLGMPETAYIAAIEMVSQADASLMNFFGLQGGIAETIAKFASDELKEKYLPRMSSGEFTGAMALTEPDAGSDLAVVATTATLVEGEDPDTGLWKVSGTKRFITNGCGDVILVLARSEDPDKRGGGRGLSFFLVEKSAAVQVRRIEDKMGIHGSPTCEIYFNNADGYLIGKRGMGLARYTAWLMLNARLAVGAQAQGIAEAALQEAVAYAQEREQFGKPIDQFPQVADLLTDMRLGTEAARALLYAASEYVDLHENAEHNGPADVAKKLKNVTNALTPIAKYYTTENANKVCYQSIAVLGGNGYMREYAVERLFRDARITNIYEGTSQIQLSWAISRLVRGDMNELLSELAGKEYADEELQALHAKVVQAQTMLAEGLEYLQEKDVDYRELVAKPATDMFIDIYVSYLFLKQAEKWDYKRAVARRFIADMLPRVAMNREYIFGKEAVALDPNA